MKIARIPLQPYSRFHFGELKMDDNLALSTSGTYARSDTLFAALVNSYSAFNGGATDFIGHFEKGEIKISSLFYYLHNGHDFIYFLPKPVFLHLDEQNVNEGNEKIIDNKHKLRNKIKFVSPGIWENNFDAHNWTKENGGYKIIDEQFVLTDEEYGRMGMDDKSNICHTTLSPKSPQRAHDGAAIFYQSDIAIGANDNFETGWYFIYSANDNHIENKLKTAVNVMAYSGIGGERHNTGRTVACKPQFGNMEIKTGENTAAHFLNLSLFCPKEKSDFKKAKYYTTSLRGGRKTPHGQTKVIRMINEGALLTSDVSGKMEELGTDEKGRSIYRLGIPLTIPYIYEKQ